MATEVKQVVEEAAAEVEQASIVAEAKKAVKQAVKAVEEVPGVAEAKEAVQEAVGSSKVSVIDQVKGVAKDVADKAQKHPVSAKVIQTAKGVQENIEKSPVTAKLKQTVKDTAESVQNSQAAEVSHKVVLVGLGMAATAQDELGDHVRRWIERGQIAEADGKKALKDVWDKRTTVIEIPTDVQKKISYDLEKRIEEIIAKMNIPTKDEIEALGAKITALTKKVDELKRSG